MQSGLNEIQKIVELLRNLQPYTSEVELEKRAHNLYELALFVVRLQVKQHSKEPKTQNAKDLEQETANSP